MQVLKIISLNIWGGRRVDELVDFLKRHQDVDIFCFQEVFNTERELEREAIKESVKNIFSQIAKVLPNHCGYFCSEQDDDEGDAMFMHKSLIVVEDDHIFIHRWRNAMDMSKGEDGRMLGRILQYIQLNWGGKHLTVAHMHGLWNGQGKTDSDDRLAQSKRVKDFLDKQDGAKVLVGDFNLLPETKSIQMLEDGIRNLIKDFGITSTRSSLYEKEERYADYAFVSPDVKVKTFAVLPDTVSDHSPLYLEIEKS